MLQELQKAYAEKIKTLQPYTSRGLNATEEKTALDLRNDMKILRDQIQNAIVKSDLTTFPIALALAIHRASELHEESFDGANISYRRDYEDCIRQAIKELNLPDSLWRIVDLAADPITSWSNDAHDWADAVLSDMFDYYYNSEEEQKSILES